jgi:hypothetical protein
MGVIRGRTGLYLPKTFWVSESDEKSYEVQIVTEEDGRCFTRRLAKRFQKDRAILFICQLDLDKLLLDDLGITLGDKCLIQLLEPTLLKIGKVKNGSAGGSGSKARGKAIPAKRSTQGEDYCAQRPASSGRGRERGRAGKLSAAPASRSPEPSPFASEPIVVGIGTKLLMVRHLHLSTFFNHLPPIFSFLYNGILNKLIN